MKNEQLAMEILREFVRNAAQTIVNDRFEYWHARYLGYHPYCSDDQFEDAIRQLDRLKGCFEREEINELFDEAEKSYRSEVDPQVWALFKSKAEPAASDRPDASIPGDIVFLV
jgi:hypothetical protein